KVAVLQGVDVLNINELANALKPIFLPGEQMNVQIIKHGKESGQGVAYLDDGTMIVVEGGDGYIGNNIKVSVTSILQTVAGRLVFAKPSKDA
ncbi:MAG: TRAM domain-containing protein, partial [bacterium]|nr:TRAM domain-containing protein [bacterium]